jgi:hypothetical protein
MLNFILGPYNSTSFYLPIQLCVKIYYLIYGNHLNDLYN